MTQVEADNHIFRLHYYEELLQPSAAFTPRPL